MSCASFPTFDEMIEESPIAFVGTVTNVNYFQDSSEDEYCSQLNSDLETGTYEFWFDVEETIKGTL